MSQETDPFSKPLLLLKSELIQRQAVSPCEIAQGAKDVLSPFIRDNAF
jgi:hypothetical protein